MKCSATKAKDTSTINKWALAKHHKALWKEACRGQEKLLIVMRNMMILVISRGEGGRKDLKAAKTTGTQWLMKGTSTWASLTMKLNANSGNKQLVKAAEVDRKGSKPKRPRKSTIRRFSRSLMNSSTLAILMTRLQGTTL